MAHFSRDIGITHSLTRDSYEDHKSLEGSSHIRMHFKREHLVYRRGRWREGLRGDFKYPKGSHVEEIWDLLCEPRG